VSILDETGHGSWAEEGTTVELIVADGLHQPLWNAPCDEGFTRRLSRRGRQEGRPGMIEWREDVDAALEEAGRTNRPVLLDFTAAPL
jgi:hypothetical protein